MRILKSNVGLAGVVAFASIASASLAATHAALSNPHAAAAHHVEQRPVNVSAGVTQRVNRPQPHFHPVSVVVSPGCRIEKRPYIDGTGHTQYLEARVCD
jgi:hypothetical protein